MRTTPHVCRLSSLSEEKVLHGLFPLERHLKKPRGLRVANRRILRRQTSSTVCKGCMKSSDKVVKKRLMLYPLSYGHLGSRPAGLEPATLIDGVPSAFAAYT
jgi:hypothetical protein